MKYEIIYTDAPWPRTSFGTAKTPYRTMTWEQLHAFDLGRWMARDCAVFCWLTGPTHLKECSVLMSWCERFGLYEAGIPYIWIKTTKDGRPVKASGPRPRGVKQVHSDHVVLLTTRKRGRVFPLLTEKQEQLIFAPKNRPGEHSRKPAETRERIVELYGDRPRIELFARERVAGWDGWGDEYP